MHFNIVLYGTVFVAIARVVLHTKLTIHVRNHSDAVHIVVFAVRLCGFGFIIYTSQLIRPPWDVGYDVGGTATNF